MVSRAGQRRTSCDGYQNRLATRPELIAAEAALGRASSRASRSPPQLRRRLKRPRKGWVVLDAKVLLHGRITSGCRSQRSREPGRSGTSDRAEQPGRQRMRSLAPQVRRSRGRDKPWLALLQRGGSGHDRHCLGRRVGLRCDYTRAAAEPRDVDPVRDLKHVGHVMADQDHG